MKERLKKDRAVLHSADIIHINTYNENPAASRLRSGNLFGGTRRGHGSKEGGMGDSWQALR